MREKNHKVMTDDDGSAKRRYLDEHMYAMGGMGMVIMGLMSVSSIPDLSLGMK